MKYTLYLFLLFVSVFIISCNQNSEKNDKLPKEERVQALAEHEFLMTHNLTTKTVPREQLYEIAQNIPVNKSPFQLQWDVRGPNNVGGRTRAVIFDKNDPSGNTLLAGGVSGGLWRCTNAKFNPTWTPIDSYNGNASIGAIAQSDEDPNVIYVGTGEGYFNADSYRGDGIYKSTDNGVTWERLQSSVDKQFRYIQDIAIVEGRIFACTRTNGIQISDDKGETWTKSLGNGVYGFSERAGDLEVASDGTLVAGMGIGTEDGIYISYDNGETWTFSDLGVGAYERIDVAISPSNPSVMYALLQDQSTNGVKYIAKTENGGIDWEMIDPPSAHGMDNFARNQAWYDLSIAVDPNDSERLFIGGIDVLLSDDGGESWTQISQWFGHESFQYVHADQHLVLFHEDDSDVVLYANDGGVFLTQNGTSPIPDIDEITEGYITTQFYSIDVHPDTITDYVLGGTQDNGSHRIISDVGVVDSDKVTGGDGGFCHIDQDNPDIQITSYVYNNYWVTLDDWGDRERYKTDENEGLFINPTDYDDENDLLYCAGENGFYNILDIHTGEFTKKSLPALNNEQVSAVHVYTPDIIYLGTTQGTILRVLNPTATVPLVSLVHSSSGYVRCVNSNPQNPNQLLATFSNYGEISVYLYDKDISPFWLSIEGNLPDFPVRWGMFSPTNPKGIILATELGIWTTDFVSGKNTVWSANNNGIPMTRIDEVQYRKDDNLLVAGSYGRGIYTSESLNTFQGYFAKPIYNIQERANDTIFYSQCAATFSRNVIYNLSKPYNEDLTFYLKDSLLTQGAGPESIVLEVDSFVIPAGEQMAEIPITLQDDKLLNQPISLEIIATNDELFFTDRTVVNLISDEINLYETDMKIKMDPTKVFNTNINDGDTLQVHQNDSLITQIVSSEGNLFECIQTQLTHTSDELYEVDSLVHINNLLYISDNGLGNEFEVTYLFNDQIKSKFNSASDSFYVFYHPEKISNPEGITWELVDGDYSIIDYGILKNGVSFPYQGSGTYTLGVKFYDLDMDGYYSDEDCDDSDSTAYQSVELFIDMDGDGYDNGTEILCFGDSIPLGFTDESLGEDCDDTNAEINPGAIDIPGNGIDEDCDGSDLVSTDDINVIDVMVYPNPTSQYVQIESNEKIERILIYDISGKRMGTQYEQQVDLGQLESGVYYLQIEVADQVVSKRIIKM